MEPSEDIKISVIIPHYEDLAALRKCLDALDRQTLPRSHFEIVVADNASPCGLAAVDAAVAGRAKLVLQAVKGAGPARNAAVAAAKGSLLAFTDSDCVPDRDWLSKGLDAAQSVDIVGGRVEVIAPADGERNGAQAFESVFAFDNKHYVERKGFSVTANLFCSRALFEATGPFRVGMSEDLEWCHRARRAGFSIGYAADVKVSHPARKDWPQLLAKWRRIQSETYALQSPTLRNKGRWLARAWAMPVSIVAHAPKIWSSTALASSGERWRALACLIRLRMWRMADAHRLAFGLRR